MFRPPLSAADSGYQIQPTGTASDMSARAAFTIFCARSEEILCFFITLVIGYLPPFDMCCVASGIHSAIHGQVRPGDVRGLRAGDKRDQRSYLINLPIAVE